MKIFKKTIKDISNLRDAFKVLKIMDKASCDIKKVEREGFEKLNYWQITTKYYVSEQDAKDLQKIILFKEHYSKESKLFRRLFYRSFRNGSRDFYYE